MRIITDNTECNKDIKNFKFKLVRRYEGRYSNHELCTLVKDIVNIKFDGIAKGERSDRIF